MCDTLGFLGKTSYFGKNSDRSPNEAQILEYYPAALNGDGDLKLTYISVPQVRETHAVLLSRPTWMWGAEIGVNDCGVCIGNEAVFTLGKYGADSLTGMDMLRLALERSASAAEARELLISLLEQYGQGGNCGYDHDFRYDNSFLIMDRENIFVLETADRKWTWKRYDRTSISNRLSIRTEGDGYSGGRSYSFAGAHTDPLFTLGSCSAARQKQTASVVEKADGLTDAMLALRTHAHGVANPFAEGTVGSACMHFGGAVGDHTTASMIAALEEKRTVIWATGSSLPCVSLYKPWLFGTATVAPVFAAGYPDAEKYWREHERFRRSLIGKVVPQDYYDRRNALEQSWMKLAASADEADFAELSRKCAEDEREFYKYWSGMELQRAKVSRPYLDRWEKKTAVFNAESLK